MYILSCMILYNWYKIKIYKYLKFYNLNKLVCSLFNKLQRYLKYRTMEVHLSKSDLNIHDNQ